MDAYRTIEGTAQAEIEEKKSRFIAQLAHAGSEEEALAFLDAVRAEHRMARHNVYAYVLRGEGAAERVRYSDDGEPQKTAGMPTLEAIRHAGLTDVCLVTTRYFGGTLLGTGGLVRAYTLAAQRVIEAAGIVTISRCVDVTATVPYPLYEQTARLAADCGGAIVDARFTDQVALRIRMLADTEQTLATKLSELLKGTDAFTVSDEFDAPFQG